ncbi:hypothetical protein OH77DRAFT_1450589 [Trametes cingulata]|nr:hypothetical protein OH77DRAFT_1450589 [Trametes cingulata]
MANNLQRHDDRTGADVLSEEGTDESGESPIPHDLLHDPELRRRNIVLRIPLKPDVVFGTAVLDAPNYVVKVFNLNTEELPIYERLLSDLRPANHTVPSEIIRSHRPLLIMPMLTRIYSYMSIAHTSSRLRLYRVFHELVEGVEYLHDSHIAHMDIYHQNVMIARSNDTAFHTNLVLERIYIIDFDTARQFSLGPGVQHAITLPETYCDPPDGLTTFDPYSWDMYCLGLLFQYFLEYSYTSKGRRAPWLARWYAKWLVGKERGCTGVCHCRPTAKRARWVLSLIRWALPVIEVAEKLVELFAS